MKKIYIFGVLDETVVYVDENNVRVVNSTGAYDYTYVLHEGQKIGQELNGVKYFMANDHLGSVSSLTNSSGAVIETTLYEPFGGIESGGEKSRFDYEGKEFSAVTEDYDFNARKYKPDIQIFSQPDDKIQSIYNPQSINPYSFELNNPYRYSDPDGHYIESAVDVAFILYDIHELRKEQSLANYLALGGDIVGAALPFTTGLGMGIKGVTKSTSRLNKVISAENVVDGVSDVSKVGSKIDRGVKPYSTLKTSSGDFLLTKHASDSLNKGRVAISDVKNTMGRTKPFDYVYKGQKYVGYYDSKTKTFVATQDGKIINTYKAREGYVKQLQSK